MGDSGATYLGGELDPVHGVLGAVVVGGAPVQVELAEPVGPAERPAPQHCGGWGGRGVSAPCPAAPPRPRRRCARAGPSLRGEGPARWPPAQSQVPGRRRTKVSPFCLARLLVLLRLKRQCHTCENRRNRAGGRLGCRQTTCGRPWVAVAGTRGAGACALRPPHAACWLRVLGQAARPF